MKTRLFLSGLVALLFVAPLLRADDAPAPAAPPAAAPAGAPDDEKKTEIEMRMDKVGKAFRKLRKQVADPAQNAASLELVATMLTNLTESEGFTPEKAADLPEDQREKFVADYKAGLKDTEAILTKLSDALKAGDNAAASALVKQVFQAEKDNHKQFTKPDKS
jgi:DNA-binding GntR family transcriptional regulator